MGLYDLDREIQSPNADRYRRIQDWEKLNSECPFAYFDNGIRDGYEARFGTIGAADPQTVQDEACYARNGSFVFIRLTSPTTADAIASAGDCPASFPAGEVRSYER